MKKEKEKDTYQFQGVIQPGYPSSLCVVFTKAGKTLLAMQSAELPRAIVPASERLNIIGREARGTVEIIDKIISDAKGASHNYQYGVVRTLELLK